LERVAICTGSLIGETEFDNEFKERSNQVDNRQPHISFDMFWFIAQTEMK
jgi:hypothetical protein